MMKWSASLSLAAVGVVATGGARDKLNEIVDKLNEMADASKADGKKERDLYATYKCWCDGNEKEKNASIKANTALEAKMEAKITKLTGGTGKLSEAAAKLTADMEENVQARTTKEEIHTKQMKEWKIEEGELTESIVSLGDAISTLGAVGADQTSDGVDSDHAQQMGQNSLLSQSSITKVQKQLRVAFDSANALGHRVPAKALAFVQAKAPFTGTYTSQSVEIMGMLKTMRDTFSENLASLQGARTKAVGEHASFMQTKKTTYVGLQSTLEAKSGNLSENDGELTEARSTLAVAQEELGADSTFLENMLTSCAAKKAEYDERQMLRTQEEAAIAQAVAVLNSDDTFDLFGKESVGSSDAAVGFLQKAASSKKQFNKQKNAVLLKLTEAARVSQSPRLAKAALMLQKQTPVDVDAHEHVGPFAPLFKAIDGMIVTIQEEASADLKKKTWCAGTRLEKRTDRDNAEIEINQHETTLIPLCDGEITDLNIALYNDHESLDANKENAKEATATRKEAHTVYNAAITDAQAAGSVLAKGLEILKAYYAKLKPTSFLQKARKFAMVRALKQSPPGEANEAAPDTFEGDYKGRSSGGNAVVDLLEELYKDVEEEAQRDHDAEIEEQGSFEVTMTDLTAERKALQDTILNNKKFLAEKKSHLEDLNLALTAEVETHTSIVNYLASIKEGCDFMKDNFDAREVNRQTELKSLTFAKDTFKQTPANQEAVAEHEQNLLGTCKDLCQGEARAFADCQACLAKVTVPAYCAGHPETGGC